MLISGQVDFRVVFKRRSDKQNGAPQ